MTANTSLLAELYLTRKAQKAAKAAHRAVIRDKGGPCDGRHHPEGPCYQSGMHERVWCATCRASQPPWDAYQKAARIAGRALRACTTRGRQIVAKRTTP